VTRSASVGSRGDAVHARSLLNRPVTVTPRMPAVPIAPPHASLLYSPLSPLLSVVSTSRLVTSGLMKEGSYILHCYSFPAHTHRLLLCLETHLGRTVGRYSLGQRKGRATSAFCLISVLQRACHLLLFFCDVTCMLWKRKVWEGGLCLWRLAIHVSMVCDLLYVSGGGCAIL